MADGPRRVYEIDVKYSQDAIKRLDELREVFRQNEQAAKGTQAAVEGLNNTLGSGVDRGGRFLKSLQEQLNTLGLNRKELLEYKAVQLEVADAAKPLIDALTKREDALRREGEAAAKNAQQLAAGASAVQRFQQSGQELVGSLREQIAAFGKQGDALTLYRAGLLGVKEPVTQLLTKLNELKATQQASADAAADAARREAEAAANKLKVKEAGEAILNSLRQEIAGFGLLGDSLTLLNAKLAGVGPEAEKLVAKLNELRAARASLDKEQSAKDSSAAQLRNQQASADAFVASLKEELATMRLSRSQLEEYKAQKLDVAQSTQALRTALAASRAEMAAEAAEAAKVAASLSAGAAAVQQYRTGADALVASLQRQIATFGKTAEEIARMDASFLGASQRVDPLLDRLAKLEAEQKREAEQAERTAKALQAGADSIERYKTAGDSLIGSLKERVAAWGKDQQALDLERASLLGRRKEVEALYQKINDLTKADELAAKAARDSKQAQDETADAIRRRKQAADNLLNSAKREVDTANKPRSQIFVEDAEKLKIPKGTYEPIAAELKNLEESAKGVGKGFLSMAFGTNGARRELLVLAHELSQGNFKQFGGSLLVLGERMDLTSALMSKVGLSIIGLTALAAGFIALVVKGALEQHKFNAALFLTGNAAGQTAASFEAMTHRISETAGTTVGATREIARGFIETGRFGPEALGSVTNAAANLARVTGKSADEVVKDFEGMTKGVANWARETNERYHFLTLAQFEYVRALEQQGRAQEAIIVANDAFAKSLDKQKENVGTLVALWRGFKQVLSGVVESIENIGKTATAGELYSAAKKQLDEARRQRDNYVPLPTNENNSDPNNTGGRLGGTLATGPSRAGRGQVAQQSKEYYEERVRQLEAIAGKLKPAADAETDYAAALARTAKAEKEGIEGSERLHSIENELRTESRVVEKLREYHDAIEKIRKSGQAIETDSRAKIADRVAKDAEGNPIGRYIPDAKLQAEDEAEIRRRNQPVAANKLADAIRDRLRALGEEDAALKEQIRQYAEYGKSINNAARAKVDFDLQKGNLKGASPAAASELRAGADAVDADKQLVREEEAYKAAAKHIEILKSEVELRPQNAREQEIAIALGKLESDVQNKLSEKYKQTVEALRQLISAKHDNEAFKKLKEDEAQTAKAVEAIDRETRLIGENTLEKQKAAAVDKILEEARKRKRDNPELTYYIDQSAARQIDEITSALERSYTAHRKFEAGAREAWTAYQEDSYNAARFAETIVTGGLKRYEDALVQFWKTGKFSFKDLFQFMADEFLRQAARMQVSQIFGNNGDKLVAGIKKLGSAIGIKLDAEDAARRPQREAPAEKISLEDLRKSEIEERNRTDRVEAAQAAAADSLTSLRTQGIEPTNTALGTLAQAANLAADALRLAAQGGGTASASGAVSFPISPTTAEAERVAFQRSQENFRRSEINAENAGYASAPSGAARTSTSSTSSGDVARVITSVSNKDVTGAALSIGKLLGIGQGGANDPVTLLKKLLGLNPSGASDPATLLKKAFGVDESIADLSKITYGSGDLSGFKSDGIGQNKEAAAIRAVESARISADQAVITSENAAIDELNVFSSQGLKTATDELGSLSSQMLETVGDLGDLGNTFSDFGDSLSSLANSFSNFDFGSASGSGDGGGWGELASFFASSEFAKGGLMSPKGALLADGGVMTEWGKLEPEHYSSGGVARRPRLAVFGEGRSHEAFIPMEDNKNIKVQVRNTNGELQAYAPLPGGRAIPVKMDIEHSDFLSGQPFMRLPDGRRLAAFAYGGVMGTDEDDLTVRPYAKGGVMSEVGDRDLTVRSFAKGGIMGGSTISLRSLPIARYADGGIMGGSTVNMRSLPVARYSDGGIESGDATALAYVPRADGSKKGGAGEVTTNVNIHVENKAPGVRVQTQETARDDGGRDIKFLIEAAVAEVDRRIATGGSTNRVLRSKGVNMNRNLPPRT